MFRLYRGVQINKGFTRGFVIEDSIKSTVLSNPKNSNYALLEELALAVTFDELRDIIEDFILSAATETMPRAEYVVLIPNSKFELVQYR